MAGREPPGSGSMVRRSFASPSSCPFVAAVTFSASVGSHAPSPANDSDCDGLGPGLGHLVHCGAGQPPTPEEPPKVEGPIEYVGPDTYILLDAEGRPQPVLGMTYDDFMAAWKNLQSVEAGVAERRFTIDELRVSGRAKNDRAELRVEISVRTSSAAAIKVPLGMAGAILTQQPRWDEAVDAGENSMHKAATPAVDCDPQAGGFVARFDGGTIERHKLVCDVLVPLVRDGNETSLRLNFPRALVSRLTLDVPTTIVDAAVSEGAILKRESANEVGTRLVADGLTGDFRLTWSTAERERRELATVLSATGAIAISIDGHSIRSDAHLSVRSFGGSFDQFRVRLPPGAQLIQDRPGELGAASPGYRVSVADETPAAGDRPRIATVELGEKQFGPVEVDLSTEQPLGLPSTDRAVELAGFEVFGEVRQFGDVAVRVADDWQLRWESGPYVRQVERADLATALHDPRPTAAFQYDRQPWSLRTRVVARPMVVHVAPDYTLELGPEEARLRAHLIYQVPGARAFEFRVQLQGWELTSEPIESNGLVDRDSMTVTRDGMLVLPLTQASSRRAEITLVLRRQTARDATELTLPLPVPEADSVAPAAVAVSASPEVELLPDLLLSRGLVPTAVTSDTRSDASASGEPLLHYRRWFPTPSLRPNARFDRARWRPRSKPRWRSISSGFKRRRTSRSRCNTSRSNSWYLTCRQAGRSATPKLKSTRSNIGRPSGNRTHDRRRAAGNGGSRFGVAAASRRVAATAAGEFPGAAQVRRGGTGSRFRGWIATTIAASARPTCGLRAIAPTISTRARAGGVARCVERLGMAAGPGGPVPIRRWTFVATQAAARAAALGSAPTLAGSAANDRSSSACGCRPGKRAARFKTARSFAFAPAVRPPPWSCRRSYRPTKSKSWWTADWRRCRRGKRAGCCIELSRSRSKPTSPSPTRSNCVTAAQPRRGSLASQEFTPPQLVGSSTLSEVYWQFVLAGRSARRANSGVAGAASTPWQWLEIVSGRRPTMTQARIGSVVGGDGPTRSVGLPKRLPFQRAGAGGVDRGADRAAMADRAGWPRASCSRWRSCGSTCR